MHASQMCSYNSEDSELKDALSLWWERGDEVSPSEGSWTQYWRRSLQAHSRGWARRPSDFVAFTEFFLSHSTTCWQRSSSDTGSELAQCGSQVEGNVRYGRLICIHELSSTRAQHCKSKYFHILPLSSLSLSPFFFLNRVLTLELFSWGKHFRAWLLYRF